MSEFQCLADRSSKFDVPEYPKLYDSGTERRNNRQSVRPDTPSLNVDLFFFVVRPHWSAAKLPVRPSSPCRHHLNRCG